MKKILLASACLLALTGAASAADLAARPYTKAPVAMASVYDWTGFISVSSVAVPGKILDRSEGEGRLRRRHRRLQLADRHVVFGLEADGSWADVNASATTLGVTLSNKIDALGTVRGRIGYAVNNVLFYGTGGYAWIDDKLSLSALGVTVSDSKFRSGWTVGAGVEAFFAPQWSVKGEYLYRSFSGATYFSGIGLPFNTGTDSFHTVQLGVNYHFSGPVVAKY